MSICASQTCPSDLEENYYYCLAPRLSLHTMSFVPLRSAIFEVFVLNRLMQIDAVNISKRTKPCEDVGEFLFLVFLIRVVHGGGEFADFFHEPAEGGPDSAFRVTGAVAFADM